MTAPGRNSDDSDPRARHRRRLGGRRVSVAVAGLALLHVAGGVAAGADAPPPAPLVELRAVSVLPSEAGSLVIQISTSAPVTYRSQVMDRPDRIVLDLADTRYAIGSGLINSGRDMVKQVRGSQFQRGVARVVIELTHPVPFQVERVPAGILVVLGRSGPPGIPATRASPPPAPAVAPPAPSEPSSPAPAPAAESPAAETRPGAVPGSGASPSSPAAAAESSPTAPPSGSAVEEVSSGRAAASSQTGPVAPAAPGSGGAEPPPPTRGPGLGSGGPMPTVPPTLDRTTTGSAAGPGTPPPAPASPGEVATRPPAGPGETAATPGQSATPVPAIPPTRPVRYPIVYGIVVRDDGATAYLRDVASGQVSPYHVGDRAGPGLIERIEERYVVLRTPQGLVRLGLDDPKPDSGDERPVVVPASPAPAAPGPSPLR